MLPTAFPGVLLMRVARPRVRARGTSSFMALWGLLIVPATFFPAGHATAAPGKTPSPDTPRDWRQATPDQTIEILNMLAAQTRGNYEAMRTWRGSYSVHSRTQLSAAQAASELKGNLKKSVDSPYSKDISFNLEFSIDLRADKIYRRKSQSKLNWIEAKSGRSLSIPGIISMNESSVVTAEEYLHFAPDLKHGTFQAVSGHPQARNRRAAFRDPPHDAEGQHRGDLLDPRLFFGLNPRQKIWEFLEMHLRVLRGEHGPELKTKFEERNQVYQALLGNEPWYRLDLRMTAPDGTTDVAGIAFRANAGFYPVEDSLWKGARGQTLQRRTQWRYTQAGGVYVPAHVVESIYDAQGLRHERESDLTNCAINEPIDSAQFTYAALGVTDGDLIMDRIDGVCYIEERGKPKKLAKFGEKYDPESELRAGRWLRWSALGAGVIGLTILVLVMYIRRRKSRLPG